MQYQQPAFDALAFNGAKEKLVHSLGYPEEVLDFEYDHKVGPERLSLVCLDWIFFTEMMFQYFVVCTSTGQEA